MKYFILFFSIFYAPTAIGAELLRTLDEVKGLSPKEAESPFQVLVEVTVLKFFKDGQAAFVHDGQWGVYLEIKQNQDSPEIYKQGDRLEIRGYTDPGEFLPHIIVEEMHLVGTKTLPDTLQMTKDLHRDPTIDCAWVSVEGIIVECAPAGSIIALRIQCYDGSETTNIILNRSPEIEAHCRELIHHRVRANVVAATKANSRRQMIKRYFQADSLKDIRVISQIREYPLSSISTLLTGQAGNLQTGKVRGTVTHISGRKIYLQDQSGGLLVISKDTPPWKPGSTLDVSGALVAQSFGPTLHALETKLSTSDLKITPIAANPGIQNIPGNWHHSLVTLQADLVDGRINQNKIILNCISSNGRLFQAILDSPSKPGALPKNGSQLKLSGICSLSSSKPHSVTQPIDGFIIILRTMDDIEILSSPPWWTAGKIFIALSILALVTGAALIWISLLRRQVKEQTSIIGMQIEREVTVRERQRLAREQHDGLEQNLSSLALQLSSVDRYRNLGNQARLEKSLSLARKTLDHCQRESRESIYDLRRSESLLTSECHDEILLNECEAHGASLQQHTSGQVFNIDPKNIHHIIKIIREATINALRHGEARLVSIHHEYLESNLRVTVTDDGRGFDPSQELPRGHFGIVGMKERAKKIGATLSISSKLGEQTVIELIVSKNTLAETL